MERMHSLPGRGTYSLRVERRPPSSTASSIIAANSFHPSVTAGRSLGSETGRHSKRFQVSSTFYHLSTLPGLRQKRQNSSPGLPPRLPLEQPHHPVPATTFLPLLSASPTSTTLRFPPQDSKCFCHPPLILPPWPRCGNFLPRLLRLLSAFSIRRRNPCPRAQIGACD